MSGYRAIALTVSSAVFMQFLDATALNTALPAIARDLRTPVVDLNIAVLAYQLALAAFIPAGNALAERIGGRNAFALAVSVFLLGSVLCAMSGSLHQLVAARTLQGLGGAAMMPVSRLLVVRSVERSELVEAMNWVVIPGVLGPLLGPGVGGLIVTYGSWHWIFLINVPIALLSIVMTFVLIPNVVDVAPGPFDLKGLALIAPAIFTMVFGLETLTRPGGVPPGAAMLAASAVFGLLYRRHARSVVAPILDLSLITIPSFRHSMVSGTLLRTILGAAGFLMPLWFQLGMGMSPARAGGLTMMGALGSLLSRFVSRPVLRALHPRTVAIYGALFTVVSLLAIANLRSDLPVALFYGALFVQGVVVSTALMVVGAVAYVDIPPARSAAATGFYTTVQQMTLSLGVTVAVWTITGMRWFERSTPYDNRTYAGSLLVLAALALVATLTTRQLDPRATGTLAPSPRRADELVE